MSAYEESNMSEAARRAYEAARRAFSDAPSVPAHGWRGTLEARAASDAAESSDSAEAVTEDSDSTKINAGPEVPGSAATPAMPAAPTAPAAQPRTAASTPSGTLRERINAARAKQAATSDSSTSTFNPFARAENEDDDGYDPWSDRREEPSFWEEDPWR